MQCMLCRKLSNSKAIIKWWYWWRWWWRQSLLQTSLILFCINESVFCTIHPIIPFGKLFWWYHCEEFSFQKIEMEIIVRPLFYFYTFCTCAFPIDDSNNLFPWNTLGGKRNEVRSTGIVLTWVQMTEKLLWIARIHFL